MSEVLGTFDILPGTVWVRTVPVHIVVERLKSPVSFAHRMYYTQSTLVHVLYFLIHLFKVAVYKHAVIAVFFLQFACTVFYRSLLSIEVCTVRTFLWCTCDVHIVSLFTICSPLHRLCRFNCVQYWASLVSHLVLASVYKWQRFPVCTVHWLPMLYFQHSYHFKCLYHI